MLGSAQPSPQRHLTRALPLVATRSTSATADTRSWERARRGAATPLLAVVKAVACSWVAIVNVFRSVN